MTTQTAPPPPNGRQLTPSIPAPSRVGQGTAVEQSRAVAEVHGAIVVAQQVPRDITRAVSDMQRSCAQKSLAEKAFFRYSRGGSQISGPSVQLARELARCFGNMQFGLVELRRDDQFGQSEMQAWAWDVQTNTRSSTTFIVQHIRDTRSGSTVLTDQRDIYENNANNGARRLREMIFAILPGWFTEDAVAACYETLSGTDEGSLAERIDGALRGFANLGITAGAIEQKLGAPQSRWTPYDLAQLTVIYRSLMRGEVRREDEFPASSRVAVADLTGAAAVASPAPAPEVPATAPPAGPSVPAATGPAAQDASQPGSVAPGAVNALWQLATAKFGFIRDDKTQWRQACEQLIGRKLTGGTTGNLSADEAARLTETFAGLAGRDEFVALLAEVASRPKPGDPQ